MNKTTTITLTGLFVSDKKEGGFTGFFSQLPGAVAEGDTVDETAKNLLHTLSIMLKVENEINQEEAHFIDGDIQTKEFQFELLTGK